MPKFTVNFEGWESVSVTVDAEDYDEAIDKAYDEMPSLDITSTGWGQSWSRDTSSNDGSIELSSVTDSEGNEVLQEDTYVDSLKNQVERLTKERNDLVAQLEEIKQSRGKLEKH